jgi:hypothetical protein
MMPFKWLNIVKMTTHTSIIFLFTTGCVTEVIARHVSRVGFQPEDLYRPQQDDSSMSEDSQVAPATTSSTGQDVIWGKHYCELIMNCGELIFVDFLVEQIDKSTRQKEIMNSSFHFYFIFNFLCSCVFF